MTLQDVTVTLTLNVSKGQVIRLGGETSPDQDIYLAMFSELY